MNDEGRAFLAMLQANDSMFPIGQFILSNGLETFVLEERLRNEEELLEYLESYLSVFRMNDLLTLQLSFEEDLIKLDQVAFALKAPEEIREGSRKLCLRFIKIWQEIEEFEALAHYYELIKKGSCNGVFPIAVGLYAKSIGLDKTMAATMFTYSQLSAIVVNAVKTIPLSQAKGQAALSKILKSVPYAIEKASEKRMEDLGVGGVMFDIEAMRHEHLYSRQYMS